MIFFFQVVLPYVPASTKQVENVMKALTSCCKSSGKKLIDLGSGDGRIVCPPFFVWLFILLEFRCYTTQVMAAARLGYQSHGVELNSVLVLYSKITAWRQRLTKATFSRQDLFKVDYSKYNNVVIFGVDEMVFKPSFCNLASSLLTKWFFFQDAWTGGPFWKVAQFIQLRHRLPLPFAKLETYHSHRWRHRYSLGLRSQMILWAL